MIIIKKILFSFVILIFIINITYGDYTLKWTNRYDGGEADVPYDIAVDSSGNVYVTGWKMFTAPVRKWYCTIKYNSSGLAIWTNSYGNGNDEAFGIAIDSSDNIYVTGYSTKTTMDYYTIQYNSSGSTIWTNSFDSGGIDEAFGIAIDSSDNIYITGISSSNYCTIKYDFFKNILWTNYYDSGGWDVAYGVAIDSFDNVYITGRSHNGTNYDYCTIKYNPSGFALWTNFYDGGNKDEAWDVAVDSSNNIYVVGYSLRATYDYCIIKYNSSGSALWTNFYDEGGNENARGVAVDSFDNIYVTGNYRTIKYNSSGSSIWTNFDGGGWRVTVATNFNPDRVFVTDGTSHGMDYFTYGIPPQRKPVNFSGIILNTNSIIWQWSDNSDDETGFQIQDAAHSIIGSVGANITVWTETGLSPNTSYTRHCNATNELGKSYDSNQEIITLSLLSPPSWISAMAVSSIQINLTWNDLSNETGYVLYRSTVNNTGTVEQITELPANTTTFDDQNLNINTTYYYWIKAKKSTNTSGFSQVISTIIFSQPDSPTWISATGISTNQIDLVWKNSINENSYILYRNTNNNTNTSIQIATITKDKTNYSDVGLQLATVYYYWLKTKDDNDTSDFSARIDAKTLLPPPPCAAWDLRSDSLPNSITIKWRPCEGLRKAPQDYDYALYRDIVPNFIITDDKLITTKKGNSGITLPYIHVNDVDVDKETIYYYKVVTIDEYGQKSAESEEISGRAGLRLRIKNRFCVINTGDRPEISYRVNDIEPVLIKAIIIDISTGDVVYQVPEEYRSNEEFNFTWDRGNIRNGVYLVEIFIKKSEDADFRIVSKERIVIVK